MRFDELNNYDVAHGEHISEVLDQLARYRPAPWAHDARQTMAKGVAFITFAYDIDGVSMEIAKYAQCFERILPGVPIHCVAGNFGDKAGVVLDPAWHRFVLDGADGWDKWDGGKWFHQLFYEDLPPDSEHSSALAVRDVEPGTRTRATAGRLHRRQRHRAPVQREHELEPRQRRVRTWRSSWRRRRPESSSSTTITTSTGRAARPGANATPARSPDRATTSSAITTTRSSSRSSSGSTRGTDVGGRRSTSTHCRTAA